MRTKITLFAVLFLAFCVLAQDKPKDTPKGNRNGAPAARAAPGIPGFVFVPAGNVHPGCTYDIFKQRHRGGAQLKLALAYDIWGSIPKERIAIPAYYIGKYEVTNAQWKLYLDREFRVEHECTGSDTLISLASKYVLFRGAPVAGEWRGIYGLNAKAIMKAIKDADAEAKKKAAEAAAKKNADPDAKKFKAKWHEKWRLQDPDPFNKKTISRIHLPKGLKLMLYKHRVPQHWYGWCRLARLRVGREYVDVSQPAADAFVVPKDPLFVELKLRAKDFARYPIRDVSAGEILAFAEWCGAHLPSEYEWERGVRADRSNTDQHNFPGKWNHRAQTRFYAWFDNKVSEKGPLAVDDPSVKQGDSPFGARHMLGNVWELTRTFWDFHPYVTPKPPEPVSGLFNYALTAKGGSFGDGWEMIQACTRTGLLGTAAELTLAGQNRVDSLGFRLVRHPQQGHDLLLHSMLRLTYEAGRGIWTKYRPQDFNMHLSCGVDEIHFAPTEGPHDYAKAKAKGIAFAPVRISNADLASIKRSRNRWRQGKADNAKDFAILGILRSDVPLRAGVRLNKAAAAKLIADRKNFKKLKEAWDRQQKNKKKKRRPKKGEEPQEPIILPPRPADPDYFENATKGKDVGLWREATVAPGEWYVVYWYGFIGLANKTLLMPPVAIVQINDKKDFLRKRQPVGESKFEIAPDLKSFRLSFSTEEQLDKKKPEHPPDEANSELWAWCEVHPDGWRRRKAKSKYSWLVNVRFPVAADALKGFSGAQKPLKTPDKTTKKNK